MLTRLSELVSAAAVRGAAVGAFTCYNLEQALGVLDAADERGRGVVLLVSAQSFSRLSGRMLLAALVATAGEARAPVCVQLDHVSELEAIRTAFAVGAGAVMADGSTLPFDENVQLVRSAVAAGAAYGGEVEAELGGIAGSEDVATAVAAGALTDPEEARAFAEQSGAACLAVSIGNVHGVYREPPALDWVRLQEIRARVRCPLSLHGASGLSDGDVRRAVARGVAKVNINTELRRVYLQETAEQLPAVTPQARVLDLNVAQARAVAQTVKGVLDVLSP